MKILYDEVIARFPEVRARLSPGDEELPYLFVGAIADWLTSVAKPVLAPGVVARVVAFDEWCFAQPRGKTAPDDVMTIAVVAFREKLFERDELLPLIPRLMTRQEMLENREYLSQWVGRGRYEKALRLFQESSR